MKALNLQPPAERLKAMLWRVKLITWSFLMFQSVSFTSAAFEAYLCFLGSASAKKNPEGIKFLGILKKYVSENKTNFCSKMKSNVLLNNKSNEKRSQEYQSMDPEYVTGQINGHILELLLRRFSCLIFARLEYLNLL